MLAYLRFDAVSSHVIEFNSLALRAAVDGDLGQDHDFLHRVMSKDNVGLAVLLQTTSDIWSSGGECYCVSLLHDAIQFR